MKPSDAISLQAFLNALARLEQPLDESIEKKLKQLASQLAENESSAIRELVRLAENNLSLKPLYEEALDNLVENYQPSHRLIPTTVESTVDKEKEGIREILANDLVQLGQKVFTADEPINLAKYVYRLTQTYTHAVDVLEKEETVWKWLNRPNRALGGVIPLELIETETGTERVNTILDRIEYGVYS